MRRWQVFILVVFVVLIFFVFVVHVMLVPVAVDEVILVIVHAFGNIECLISIVQVEILRGIRMEEIRIGLMLVGDVIVHQFLVGFVVEKHLCRTGWLNQSMLIVRLVETRMGTVGDRHALCIVNEFIG